MVQTISIRSSAHDTKKSGFVALVGRPNVGKSSLINTLVGQKVSIVTPKPQTTRNQIRAVLTEARGQIVFLDTPGMHQGKTSLSQVMLKTALRAFSAVDLVLLVFDAGDGLTAQDVTLIRRLPKGQGAKPVIALMNKIDLINREKLLSLIDALRQTYDFAEYIPVSAKTGEGLSVLLDVLFQQLPEGPRYYPENVTTDASPKFLVAEIIREKLLLKLQQEVPHALAVAVEEMTEESGRLLVRAVIVVERPSHKKIVIGKGGAMLKEVGMLARQELEALFGVRMYLELWVKVREDWRNRPSQLKEFGYFEE
ncbi:MAG: GTP-binding protein Era [Candidatus Carbobacillus altaicus]|uniref:GTPase Era n=1 Tax=Candidatus Carbonibacillus altaicus TaxID=2163959 RepID=A0A2R6Y338_9BACL|nr:MAG: GTP-binding protein Era [Candidatus Carbobacillus altaicus]